MDSKARTHSKKKKEENEELKAKLDDALAHIKIVEGKLLGVLAKNKLASKREGAVNIGHDKLTYIAATVLSLEMDLEGDCPDNLDDDEVLYDKWHDSFINLLEKAQYPPNLNVNIAENEYDKYIDSHRDDAEVYLAYKRMVLNLKDIKQFVFRLFPEYKAEWTFEDRFDLVKNHVHKTIPLRLDDNSDQSSNDDSDQSSDDSKGDASKAQSKDAEESEEESEDKPEKCSLCGYPLNDEDNEGNKCDETCVQYWIDMDDDFLLRSHHAIPEYSAIPDNILELQPMKDRLKEIEQDKEFCEVGEHYVDKEDHWKNNGHPLCGDCMNCTNEKELEELGLELEDVESSINYDKYPKRSHQMECRCCGDFGWYEDIADDADDDEYGTCGACDESRQSKRQSKDLEDAKNRIKILEEKNSELESKLASKEALEIDTSIPIDVGMSEEVDVSDNHWVCHQFKSADGNLEYIALSHPGNILLLDYESYKCEIIDQSYIYFNKEGKLFIEHYSYSMKKGEKRLDDGRLTDKSFGSDSDQSSDYDSDNVDIDDV